ncbi:MAG: uracil-DNA glycosylase [Candidatus Aureabacteria bacterium]|nr:uracil-DNA glycosylase [Candidatus Auribacterota bacterium]
MNDISELREIVRLTRQYLERLVGDGFSHVLLGATPGESGKSGPHAEPSEVIQPITVKPQLRKENGMERAMEEIRNRVDGCRKCGLAKTRKKTVFGSGSPRASVLFIGEAPGAEEDRQGLPFVGRAGQLLTKMLAFIGLKREDVYITNVLKCRPPGNRDPQPDEVACCEPYLLAQLDIIKPRLICALGRHAAQTLLKTEEGINRLRGRFHDYHGIKILPTYHPAYLLYSPGDKDKAKDDLSKLRAYLDESS